MKQLVTMFWVSKVRFIIILIALYPFFVAAASDHLESIQGKWISDLGSLTLNITEATSERTSADSKTVTFHVEVNNHSGTPLSLMTNEGLENFLVSDEETGNVYWARPGEAFPSEFPSGQVTKATLVATDLASSVTVVSLVVMDMTGPVEANFDTFAVSDIPVP